VLNPAPSKHVKIVNQSTILSAGENIMAIMDLIIKFASMLSKSDGTVFIYI
jgi:hypothetical protein